MIKTLASYERESLMLLEGRRGEAERGRTRRVRGNRQREEDTCVSYEDDDTCMTKTLHVRGNEKKKTRPCMSGEMGRREAEREERGGI